LRTKTLNFSKSSTRNLKLVTGNYLLAALSGLLMALTFPKFNLWWLSFVWPMVLLEVISRQPSAKACFKAGWIAGFSAFLIIFYWIPVTVHVGGGGRIVALMSWTLLASYLALFPALFSVLTRSAFKAPYFLIAPAVGLAWIITEWLRATLFGGFPWCLSGYALSSSLSLIQWAQLGGIYLLGFIPVCLATFFWLAYKRNNARFALWGTILLVSLIFSGHNKYKQIENSIKASDYKIAILQGSVDQYAKWDENHAQEIVSVYRKLYREANLHDPALILWPESAWPYLEKATKATQATNATKAKEKMGIEKELRKEKIPHLVGVMIEDEEGLYNSAVLIKEGEVRERYDKVHLVPFGEYLPFGDWMRRWVKVLGNLGFLNAGRTFPSMQVNPNLKVAATICYESIFPVITKELPISKINAIVNLTNDGWYLDTAGPYQHFQMNRVRAVESRLTVIRAANNGISAIITPSGSIAAATKLNERRLLISPIYTLSR